MATSNTPAPRRPNIQLRARSEAAARLMKEPAEVSLAEAGFRAEAARRLLEAIPPELQHEQPSVIVGRFDEVSGLVEQFNLHARRLGAKYGVHGFDFDIALHEKAEVGDVQASVLALFTETMSRLAMPRECFQLTRVGDQGWGVYYRWRPPFMGALSGSPEVCQSITGVRVDLKRLFLRKSSEFFQAYLTQVRDTVGEVDTDIKNAAAVLETLKKIE